MSHAKPFGSYVCRVDFFNDCPRGFDYPVIGSIYAKFYYHNGDTTVSQQAVTLRPGDHGYLYSRSSDDPNVECVQKVDMVMSWLYEDGSADSGGGSDSCNPDQCITLTGLTLDLTNTVKFGQRGPWPPVQVYAADSKAGGAKRLVWSAESEAHRREMVEAMRQELRKT